MGITRFKPLIANTQRDLFESKELGRVHPKLATLLELEGSLDPIGCMCLVDLIIRNMTNPIMKFGNFNFAGKLLSNFVIWLDQDEVNYLHFDPRSPFIEFVGGEMKLDTIKHSHITFLVTGHIKSLEESNSPRAIILEDYRFELERYVSTLVGNSDSKALEDYRKKVMDLKSQVVATVWNQDYKLMGLITEEDKTKKLIRLTRHISTLTAENNQLTRQVNELGRKLMELTVAVQRMQAGQSANLEQEGQPPAEAVRGVPPRSPSPHPIVNYGGILLAAPSAAAASASASAAAASPADNPKRKFIPLALSS